MFTAIIAGQSHLNFTLRTYDYAGMQFACGVKF